LHLAKLYTCLRVARQYASEAGGKLFVTGGVTHHRGFPAVSHAFSELLAFDGESWRVHAEMSEGSCYSAVVGLPELSHPEVWVIGGGGPTLPGPLATTQIFDARSGTRREGIPLPAGRLGCIGAAVGGRVYVIGGSGGFGGQAFDECLSISPGEQEWRHETPAPGGPLPAATLAGCELHGKIYVLGGTAILSAIYRYLL
jgi:N-acetylneuraminic acid mutarotase